MSNPLFWTYIINAALLINHEIDSAYWKEWELFKLPGGIGGFLIIHFPLIFLVLIGLVEVYKNTVPGFIFSLMLSVGGIAAFVIHTVFLIKGREEFKKPISIAILVAVLLVSVFQLGLTLANII